MTHSPIQPDQLSQWIAGACSMVPPLWPLDSYVAVNPFLGLGGMKLPEANRVIKRTRHTEIFLPASDFITRCKKREIQEADFITARDLLAATLPESDARLVAGWEFAGWQELLLQAARSGGGSDHIRTFAEHCDAELGTVWHTFIVDEISKWCASYYDEGQAAWSFPRRETTLFQAFRSVAFNDLNPEMMGMKGFRETLRHLPAEPEQLVGEGLRRLRVPASYAGHLLARQLMTIAGWSGYIQHRVHKSGLRGQPDRSLTELLAIRMIYDLAVAANYANQENLQSTWAHQLTPAEPAPGDEAGELARLLGHYAMEASYQRKLFRDVGARRIPARNHVRRPSVQAVFCIDVRSEVLRRHLELAGPHIETIGFAGFFGMPFEYLRTGDAAGKSQCPVLMEPRYRAYEAEEAGTGRLSLRPATSKAFRHAWDSFRRSAVSSFGYVETFGLGAILSLTRDSLAIPSAERGRKPGPIRLGSRSGHLCGGADARALDQDEQIQLAATMLKNIGLRTNFARLVLLCGHGSQTKNNPYGAALDCGACGGQAGDVNARIAAMLLNSTEVRAGLADHGIQIPGDTLFVAGIHNTTTDEVKLFDLDSLPPSHREDVHALHACLLRAGQFARQERQAQDPGATPGNSGATLTAAQRKSADWSQVRPEWGLAGNAAFLAAPRELTRGVPLDGRVFLHNYQCETDKDDSVLELILTAPVVVASWINLQYYASRIDNVTFGSGNKTIHNVVGTVGIWQGNAGDLQTGLPLQSLHNGRKWMHEPLRLSVVIRARNEAISKVLRKHPAVENLFANGWLHLFAMAPDTGDIHRYLGGGQWLAVSNHDQSHEPGVADGAVNLSR